MLDLIFLDGGQFRWILSGMVEVLRQNRELVSGADAKDVTYQNYPTFNSCQELKMQTATWHAICGGEKCEKLIEICSPIGINIVTLTIYNHCPDKYRLSFKDIDEPYYKITQKKEAGVEIASIELSINLSDITKILSYFIYEKKSTK